MSKFLIDKLKSLEAYVPGEQPRDKKYIKLNTNESPYPPSKHTIDSVNKAEVENLKLYSDPTCKLLKEKIADKFAVLPENVYVGNGSDECLNFFFMAFCDNVVFPDITYGFYNVFAQLYGINYKEIPLTEDFSVNPKDYINVGANVVIANPNAPTGKTISLDEIEEIVKSNKDYIVVIDEAYVDFGGETAIKLTEKYDNLLVVRTFSKSYSLAGARLGFAIGHKDIISDLEMIKYSTNPYNINRLTQIAGVSAIESAKYYEDNCKKIIDTREYTKNELKSLGFQVLDSKANFIFAKHPDLDGEYIYKSLKDRGILVRHFTKERIKDFNRITIGSTDEMEEFINTIKLIVKGD